MSIDFVAKLSSDSSAWIEEIDAHPLISCITRGDASREQYVAFLAGSYHYVRWSGPILARTAEGLRRSPHLAWLAAIMDRKTAEEAPHDRWILDDLARCGANVELIKASDPPVAVNAYVAFSLTMADQGSPAFLGAAHALEVLSMQRASVAARNLRTQRAYAVSFLEGHGEADPGHVDALNEVLNRIDEPRDQESIALASSVLRALYPLFFVPSIGPAHHLTGSG